MTGAGAPDITPLDATGLSVTIVAGSWHETIAEGLLAGATRYLETTHADVTVVRVAGSFELPVVCRAALDAGADAVVALGVIIRGGTPHFEYVADAATSGLTQVSVLTGKPVGFGVLTVDNEQQALDRAGLADSKEDKGAEAAEAGRVDSARHQEPVQNRRHEARGFRIMKNPLIYIKIVVILGSLVLAGFFVQRVFFA